MTGTPPSEIICLIAFALVSITVPTKPSSLSSILHLKILSTIETADTFLFCSADVILLFSVLKTSIASIRTSLEVTLCPFLNENLIFFSSNTLESLGPPP